MPDAIDTLTVFFPIEVNQRNVEAQYKKARQIELIQTRLLDNPFALKYVDGEQSCDLGKKKIFNANATTIMD
jgi:hypothetical protein